jgi:hypothetical protein
LVLLRCLQYILLDSRRFERCALTRFLKFFSILDNIICSSRPSSRRSTHLELYMSLLRLESFFLQFLSPALTCFSLEERFLVALLKTRELF